MKAAPLAAITVRARALRERIDRLPQRERALLLVGALSLALAIELLWVRPLQQRRASVLASAEASTREAVDARSAAERATLQERAELEASLRKLDAELAKRGSAGANEPLADMFDRLLARQPVRIEALRELAAEEVAVRLPTEPAEAAAAVAAGPAAAEPAPLVRHRFELVLGGEAAALVTALRSLEQGARPLRVERARLHAGEGGARVSLSITFTALGTERTWLTL